MYFQVRWSGVRSQNCTNPFVDDMYDRLKETLVEYEVIVHRWPEYAFVLESVCTTFAFHSLMYYLLKFILMVGYEWSWFLAKWGDRPN